MTTKETEKLIENYKRDHSAMTPTEDEILRTGESLRDENDKLHARIAELEAGNEKMRIALEAIVKWADDLRYFSDRGTELAPVFQEAKKALAP